MRRTLVRYHSHANTLSWHSGQKSTLQHARLFAVASSPPVVPPLLWYVVAVFSKIGRMKGWEEDDAEGINRSGGRYKCALIDALALGHH